MFMYLLFRFAICYRKNGRRVTNIQRSISNTLASVEATHSNFPSDFPNACMHACILSRLAICASMEHSNCGPGWTLNRNSRSHAIINLNLLEKIKHQQCGIFVDEELQRMRQLISRASNSVIIEAYRFEIKYRNLFEPLALIHSLSDVCECNILFNYFFHESVVVTNHNSRISP